MNTLLKTISASLLLSSSLSFADSIEYPALHGFYLGAGIGALSLIDKEAEVVQPQTHQLGRMGILGSAFVGYFYGFSNQCGLGFEVFADAMNPLTEIIHVPFTYEQKQHYDFGLRLLPELALSPTANAHLIFGYVNGKFSITDNGVYGYIDTGYHKSGFQTGIGFSSLLCNNFSVRLDGLYNFFGSQNNIGAGLNAGAIQVYENRYQNLVGELSLVYHG